MNETLESHHRGEAFCDATQAGFFKGLVTGTKILTWTMLFGVWSDS